MKQSIYNSIGNIDVEDSSLLNPSDNLMIVLLSYFEMHKDRPVDDEENEDGWSIWALEKAEAALLEITKETRKIFRDEFRAKEVH